MKKRVIISIILTTIIATAIALAQSSFGWETQKIDKEKENITIQTTYLKEPTISINLKSSNKSSEKSNILTRENLENLIKEKYGVSLVKEVYKTDGKTKINKNEKVGTGYKVELLTKAELRVILYGDVNSDGEVNTQDSVSIAMYNVHKIKFDKYQEKAAKLTQVKKPSINTTDSVRLAYYNVNGLKTNITGTTIVDEELYPADEKFESGIKLENINKADEVYKTALSKLTKNKFTRNNDDLKFENNKLTGTVNYNFAVDKEIYPEEELTGYYFGYVIKATGANANTTLKIKNSDNKVEEIGYTSFNSEEGISKLASLSKTAKNKKIEIEVDLDGKGTLYKPYTITIDYTGLSYGDMVSATISNNIPVADAEELEGSKWNYRFEFKHSHSEDEGYAIEKTGKNQYKATGIITQQDQVRGFNGNAKTNFYLVFAIEPSYIDDKMTIQIPLGDGSYKTLGKNDLKEGKLTAIISVNESRKSNLLRIKIDLDGNGKRFSEEEITIDYSNLKFEKSSEFSVNKELPSGQEESIKTKLNGLGFKPDEYINLIGGKDNLAITVDGLNKQFYKVTGTIPKMFNVNAGFDGEKDGGYYIVFTVKMKSSGSSTNNINEDVEIKLTSPATSENIRVLNKDSFDTATEMVVLWKLEERDDKTLKVTIDLDGDKDEYAPYHIILDYSDVVFQKETTASISLDETDIAKADINILKDLGYKLQSEIKLSAENKNITEQQKKDEITYDSQTGLVSGIIKEQKLTKGFNANELDSYFFTFTIKPDVKDADIKNIKVTVEDNENPEKKEFTYEDFSDGTLTILKHIPKNFEKCTGKDCCQEGKCTNPEKCEKAIKVVVDLDGDSQYAYKPSETYYIDFCNADLLDLHTVTFKDKNEKNTNQNILVEDVYDGENAKEPAVVPTSSLHFNTFDYWVKEDALENTKFELNAKENAITEDITLTPIWSVDVDEYIEKSLEIINAKPSVKDNFSISLDEVNEQDSITKVLTVNIKNNNTKLQDINDTAIASAIAHTFTSGEVESITLELEDKEKEFTKATLASKEENAIKDDVKQGIENDILHQLFSESYETKTLKDLYDKCEKQPNPAIGQNHILIMLDSKYAHADDNVVNAGVNYEIKFKRNAEIKFDTGAVKESITDILVPMGEQIESLPTPKIPELPKDLGIEKIREFDGWYSEDNEKYEAGKKIEKDVTLKAHYNLYVDNFVQAIVKDLNSSNETYSDNFSGKFNLNKEGNNITINVDSPNVLLTELAKTSIPGTIAYVLGQEEIPSITLKVGDDGEEVKFNTSYSTESKTYEGTAERDEELLGPTGTGLKKEIIEGAKEAFDTELSGKEADATLDQLEYENKKFTLTIESPEDDTVKLVKKGTGETPENITEAEKKYTFSFDSDFAVVKQEPKSNLGVKDIQTAVGNSKNYNTIYIDGNYEVSKEIDITAEHNITIKPINENSREITTTIQATGEGVDYAMDIQPGSGEVTISNLKITGGKKSELRIEEGANVVANNVDVSGNITPSKDKSEEMNAAIIVKGTLNASNITNNDEKYALPTISVVTGYTYDQEIGKEDGLPSTNLGTKAVVTANGMTKNKSYCIIDKSDPKIHKSKETYYGSFYYIKPDNSKIYYMGVKDDVTGTSGYPYKCIQAYYYNDTIDIKSLGYESGKEPTKDNKVFDYFRVGTNDSNKITDNNSKAQDKLAAHTTTVIYAVYKQNPSMAVSLPSTPGLELQGNKLSGIIKTQSEDNKFYIPVELTSDKFNDETTIKVIDPNDEEKDYKYSSSDSGIMTASTSNTIKLNLEAIKTSKIKTDKGKVYNIVLDIDGDKTGYDKENYIIDYGSVETLEEIINEAAARTQNANSLKLIKDNNVKGKPDSYTLEYNKEEKRKYLTAGDKDNLEEYYMFSKDEFYPGTNSNIVIYTSKSKEPIQEGRVYLNDWIYNSKLKTGYGVFELRLLQDLIRDDKMVGAIDRVTVKGDNKYEVKINKELLASWLDNTYMDGENITKDLITDDEVKIEVTLVENNRFIGSMKTTAPFQIKTYSNNSINVQMQNINKTSVKTPQEVLGKDGKNATDEEIKKFIQDGKEWWEKYTGSTSYEG